MKINIYDEIGNPVGQCQTEEYAAQIVSAVNGIAELRKVNDTMLEALLVVQRSVPTIYFSTSCKCVPAAIAAATAQEKA